MRIRFPRKAAPAWLPTNDDADARFYRADLPESITSSSSATRHRMGTIGRSFTPAATLVGAISDSATEITVSSTATFRQATPYEIRFDDTGEIVNVTAVDGNDLTVTRGHAGTDAAAHADGALVRLGPLDGQGLVELASGRLLLLGGAIFGHAFGPNERVNIVWSSDDRGRTWEMLLGDTAGTSTRPDRGHTLGFFTATYGGTLYVYWLGGDPFAPTGDVFRIPASALDVGGNPATAWTRISTTCPTSGLALFMYGVLPNGNIYVIGGQESIFDGAASRETYVSTDQGATWTNTGLDCPTTVWSAQVGPLPVKGGKFWICGSARYLDGGVPDDFSNAVVTFDGSTWATVLADGHAEFPKHRYHSVVVYRDRLWMFNGTVSDGVTIESDTRSIHYSADGVTWTEWGSSPPWPETHAQAALATSDGIYLTSGFADAAIYVIREHTGALVSAWADQGSAGLDVAQADDAAKPLYDPSAFLGRGGLVFTRAQFLELVAPDRDLGDGFFECWAIVQTLNFDASPENAGPNPPCVVIGATNESSFNNFGLVDSELSYKQAPAGYVESRPDPAPPPLNDDRPHLIGIQHQNGSLKFFVDGVQVGETVTEDIGFSSSFTGWEAFGAGYLETDRGEFLLAEAVVRTTGAVSNSTYIGKLAVRAASYGVGS